MKIIVRYILLGISVFVFSVLPARADTPVSGKVVWLQSYNSHTGLLVHLDTAAINPDGCALASWYIFPDNSPRAQFVQSALLSAYQSGKQVTLSLSGCQENYPKVLHVILN